MCIYLKVLGLCLFCFLNICLKYCYIKMNWYTRLHGALCGIFKEESRKFELVCGLHPKALTIHQTLVTVSVCNSSWWHLVKAIDHQKSRKQLKGAGYALVLLSRFCLKVSRCVYSTKQVKVGFFFFFCSSACGHWASPDLSAVRKWRVLPSSRRCQSLGASCLLTFLPSSPFSGGS